MPAGRPTKLTPEMMKKAEGFLDWNATQTLTRYFNTKDGPVTQQIPKPPTMTGLALYLEVDRTTLNEWAKENKEFSHIFTQVRAKYEESLVGNGLSETYNPGLAKFLLSADHDKREKSDITTNGKDLPTPIIAADVQGHDRHAEGAGDEKAD